VYNIELSFLGETAAVDGTSQESQIRYNNIYKEVICQKLKHSHINSSQTDTPETLTDKIIEIECKGVLNSFFCIVKSDNRITLNKSDLILIKVGDNIEIAKISEIGELAELKYNLREEDKNDLPVFLRVMDNNDIIKFNSNYEDELNAIPIFRKAVEKYKLSMKLVDIHFQFDRKKLFFYYTSDGRVDFRELAKELASHFKTRIELRQIGVRDEAKRIGGLGTCGREFCCASFLSNFKRITTQIANDQNLSSNMSKLSGPCGKLKCCLSYEV
jgi:cell fate regulator YaaT (PSP1 superfamily)